MHFVGFPKGFPALPALTLASLLLLAGGSAARAQGNNPLITVNENGAGSIAFPGGASVTTTGTLAADPGPGGLALALTYNLLGPPGLVAGDLILSSPGTATTADIIRFNPAGTSAGYPASLVFYSLNTDGAATLAATGFPSALYALTATGTETDLGGGNRQFLYTPTASQPGFVSGFSVTYNILSTVGPSATAAPEPGSLTLLLPVMGAVGMVIRRRRK